MRDAQVSITYRRGALKVSLVKPATHPYPPAEAGIHGCVQLADELVEFKDYGTCRQLTLFENGVARRQVLTSDLTADGPALLAWLRSRWRIENAIKDLSRFYGIDWLCDYRADLADDDSPVDNPARKAALHTVHDRETDLAAAERDLARLVESPTRPIELINNQIPAARNRVTAKDHLARAKAAHKAIPAKIPVNQLKPGAQRALPQTGRRSLQMVLRLLAYNTELWLADHLNAYLRDDNEYRAAMRRLLHLGGTLDYRTETITVTLDQPDSPQPRAAESTAATAPLGAFERGVAALAQYKARTGSVTVPRGHVEQLEDGTDVRLGVWNMNQKGRRGKLTADKLAALAVLGLEWA